MHAQVEPDEGLDELVELWHELANDPDSPDRLEITEHGEIILSPPPATKASLGTWRGNWRSSLAAVRFQRLPFSRAQRAFAAPTLRGCPTSGWPKSRSTVR